MQHCTSLTVCKLEVWQPLLLDRNAAAFRVKQAAATGLVIISRRQFSISTDEMICHCSNYYTKSPALCCQLVDQYTCKVAEQGHHAGATRMIPIKVVPPNSYFLFVLMNMTISNQHTPGPLAHKRHSGYMLSEILGALTNHFHFHVN